MNTAAAGVGVAVAVDQVVVAVAADQVVVTVVVADICSGDGGGGGGGRRHSARARRVAMRPIDIAVVVPGPNPKDVSAVREVADAVRTLNDR